MSDQLYICPYCGKSFKSEKAYNRHVTQCERSFLGLPAPSEYIRLPKIKIPDKGLSQVVMRMSPQKSSQVPSSIDTSNMDPQTLALLAAKDYLVQATYARAKRMFLEEDLRLKEIEEAIKRMKEREMAKYNASAAQQVMQVAANPYFREVLKNMDDKEFSRLVTLSSAVAASQSGGFPAWLIPFMIQASSANQAQQQNGIYQVLSKQIETTTNMVLSHMKETIRMITRTIRMISRRLDKLERMMLEKKKSPEEDTIKKELDKLRDELTLSLIHI